MFSGIFLLLTLTQQTEEGPTSRPNELLQARSCPSTVRGNVDFSPSDQDVAVEADGVPACLVPIFKTLGTEALRLAATDDAKVVLYVGVGRAFNSATLLFSSPGDPRIHYVDELSPISEKLSAEWGDYLSPDGELGWSGFVLVVERTQTRIRFLKSASSPFDVYGMSTRLEAEYFPDKAY